MHTGTSSTTVSTYVHLVDPKRNWYNNKRIIILNFWILLLLLTSTTSSYTGIIPFSFQGLPQWTVYFNNPAGATFQWLNAMQTIGSFVALPISPYVADGLGRRTSIYIGALIMCIATVIQTVAISLGMFMGARFLVGFGLTFSVAAAPILIAEIAYPAYRAPLTSAYGSLWYTGAIAAAWSMFGAARIQTTWSWRLLSIVQAIPSVLQLVLIWFGPESPRWLMSKNRNEEALKTLAYYHADSNEDDPLVRFEYDTIKAAIDHEVAANFGWKSLFATEAYKKRANVLFLLAFISPWYAYPFQKALVSVGIANSGTLLLLNSILQIWNLLWSLLAASLVDRVGRRNLFLASLAGAILFFSLLTTCSTVYATTGNQAAARAFIAMVFLFFSFFNLAFPTLLVSYSVEIFPYSLRAKGLTFFGFANCLGTMIAQHVHLPFGLGAFNLNIMYVVVLLVQALACAYFIVETKNRTLEETGTVFDGDSGTGQVVSAKQTSSNCTQEDDKPSQASHETVGNGV